MMRPDYTILGSVVSEKAYTLNAQGLYVLKVAAKATKADVCNALKTLFNVDVVKINTLITRGKVRRKSRSKKSAPIYVKLSNTKKAIVKLKAGQTLPLSVLQKNEAKAS